MRRLIGISILAFILGTLLAFLIVDFITTFIN
jgi:hypothetical protein